MLFEFVAEFVTEFVTKIVFLRVCACEFYPHQQPYNQNTAWMSGAVA